jgi:hypothetical protein
VYRSIEEFQADLDLWLRESPMQTSLDAMPMAKKRMIPA